MKRLAAAALLLWLGAGPLAAHPLGYGLLNIGADVEAAARWQSGDYNASGRTFHAKDTDKNVYDYWAQLAMPVGPGVALEGSWQPFTQTLEISRGSDAPYYDLLTLNQEMEGTAYEAAVRIWPSEWFQAPFETSDDGNPDGRLLWPSFWVSGDWQADTITYHIVSRAGGYSGATEAAPATERYFSAHYGLVLPLTANLSLRGSYGREYSYQSQAGSATYSDGGDSEFESLGMAAFFTLLRRAHLHQPSHYVPLVGFVGQYRLGLDYRRQYHIPSGRTLAQGLNLSLTIPFKKAWAMGLNYSMVAADQGYLYGTPGLSNIKGTLTAQTVGISTTINFASFFDRGPL